jgi:hypothetical protein
MNFCLLLLSSEFGIFFRLQNFRSELHSNSEIATAVHRRLVEKRCSLHVCVPIIRSD